MVTRNVNVSNEINLNVDSCGSEYFSLEFSLTEIAFNHNYAKYFRIAFSQYFGRREILLTLGATSTIVIKSLSHVSILNF